MKGFGVRREDDALIVKATPRDFSLRKHNLVQAMLAANDLFYLAVPAVASLFLDDVTAWLELHKTRFTPDVKYSDSSTGFARLTAAFDARTGAESAKTHFSRLLPRVGLEP